MPNVHIYIIAHFSSSAFPVDRKKEVVSMSSDAGTLKYLTLVLQAENLKFRRTYFRTSSICSGVYILYSFKILRNPTRLSLLFKLLVFFISHSNQLFHRISYFFRGFRRIFHFCMNFFPNVIFNFFHFRL